jgi:hypothetical protein
VITKNEIKLKIRKNLKIGTKCPHVSHGFELVWKMTIDPLICEVYVFSTQKVSE